MNFKLVIGATVLALALVACGGKTETPAPAAPAADSAMAPAPAAPAADSAMAPAATPAPAADSAMAPAAAPAAEQKDAK